MAIGNNTQINNRNECGNIPSGGCPTGEVWYDWPTCQCVSEHHMGCTDNRACNYDVTAVEDDGSCWSATDGCDCSYGEGAVIDVCGICDGPGDIFCWNGINAECDLANCQPKPIGEVIEPPTLDDSGEIIGKRVCPYELVPYYRDSDGDGLYDPGMIVCDMVCELFIAHGIEQVPMFNGFPCVPETEPDPFPNETNIGCTDMNACNYDRYAVIHDTGSCEYVSDCAGICGGDLKVDDCGICGGPGHMTCWDGSFECDFNLCPDIPDILQFGISSIYIEGDGGGLPLRNFVGFTLPMRDTLVCAGTFPPGISDDECIATPVGTPCGEWESGVCHYYDITNVMTNSFFQSDPDLIEDGDELPPLQSFAAGDHLVTKYIHDDGTLIEGQVSYNENFELWMGNIKFLEPGRGYKLYTTNSGWIKWRFEE